MRLVGWVRRDGNWLLVVGAVLFVGGIGAALTAPRASASFGWFAYAPLPAAVSLQSGGIITSAGELVAAVGLALVTGVAGYQLGRRKRR